MILVDFLSRVVFVLPDSAYDESGLEIGIFLISSMELLTNSGENGNQQELDCLESLNFSTGAWRCCLDVYAVQPSGFSVMTEETIVSNVSASAIGFASWRAVIYKAGFFL